MQSLESYIEKKYWDAHGDFLPDVVEGWKRGVSERRKELFRSRESDPIPGYNVDFEEVKNEKRSNFIEGYRRGTEKRRGSKYNKNKGKVTA